MSDLIVDNVHLAYGNSRVLKGTSFTLPKGSIGCLLGPSGCGKTSVLRSICGFEPVTVGTIHIGHKLVSQPDFMMPPEDREVSMVFQDYALFPHLNVAGNIAFGLHRMSPSTRQARVNQLLQLVGLDAHAEHYPHQLSGGEQQRVALARALAPYPRVLLMDEPFSSLDVELRGRLSIEVRDILKREAITALVVTHDQNEAFAMADWAGVLHEGKVQQWDTPYRLYHEPINRFVADFVGQGVLVSGRVLNSKQVETDFGILNGRIPVDCNDYGCDVCDKHCRVDVLFRPDDIIHDDESKLQALVLNKAFRGAEFLYTLQLPSGQKALSLVPSHHNHAIGEFIGVRLAADHVITFRPEA